MTLPQVFHVLGWTPDAPTIAAVARHRIFDRILHRRRWTPSRLLNLPISEIEREIREENPTGIIDRAALPRQIEQYIREKRMGSEST